MTLEAQLYATLSPLVAGAAFPDVAPSGQPVPYITYQQVGGRAYNLLEAVPVGLRNARIQINCWAATRVAAAALSRAAEDALVAGLRGFVLGAPVATYEEDLQLYGTRQDISIDF